MQIVGFVICITRTIARYRNENVEFYSKNKFEKLVDLVGFSIRIYDDARSPELQIPVARFRSQPIRRSGEMGLRNCDVSLSLHLLSFYKLSNFICYLVLLNYTCS